MKGKNYLRLFAFLALSTCLCMSSCTTKSKLKNWSIEKDGGVRIVMHIQLSDSSESTIPTFIDVLRKRIEHLGVPSNIQKLDSLGKIQIDLPSMAEPERVRNILTKTGELEFWPTFDHSEIEVFLSRLKDPQKDLLNPDNIYGPCMGVVKCEDTAEVNKYLSLPEVKAALPEGLLPMWGVKPAGRDSSYFELIAIKDEGGEGKAPLDGSYIVDASGYHNKYYYFNAVSIKMNETGAKIWEKMTEDNIAKCIAMVSDGLVYSYPTVNEAITGGSSQITGNFTIEEAVDLASILMSGKLPAPAVIIEEQVIEPAKK